MLLFALRHNQREKTIKKDLESRRDERLERACQFPHLYIVHVRILSYINLGMHLVSMYIYKLIRFSLSHLTFLCI